MKAYSSMASVLMAASIIISCGATRAADYALRTGQNGFFRTTQTSDQISSLDGYSTIGFWFKASGRGVLVNEVDAFNELFWDVSWAEIANDGKVLIGLPGLTGVAEVGTIIFNSWNHLAIRYEGSAQSFRALLNGQS